MTRTILITGATDGIGLALAQRYATQGARLILVGRRGLAALTDPLFTATTYCQADLAAPDCAATIQAWLDAQDIGKLDLLINNAGTGYAGSIAEQSVESILRLEAVNLRAPMAITHALLPLVEQARGRIVFIGSVASVLPSPGYAVYSATKAALDEFVRALQVELAHADSPVWAVMLHPGATRTGIHAKSGMRPDKRQNFAPVAKVARRIEAGSQRNRRRSGVGFLNNLVYQSAYRWPEPVEAVIRSPALPPTREKDERHAVITGAADGIGHALALTFGGEGYRITGLDRDEEKSLRTQAELINQGGQGRFLLTDLSDTAMIERAAATLAQRPLINVLIHNAGISAVGQFARLPLARQMDVLTINFTAPLLLTRHLLAAERLAPGATVVFISSLSVFTGYPGAAAYAASKAGVASYARSLAAASTGLNVLTVYPGPTRTAHARRYSPDNSREERRMAPDVLARRIFTAAENGKRRLIPGPANRAFALAGRWLPGVTEEVLRRTLLAKLEDDDDAAP